MKAIHRFNFEVDTCRMLIMKKYFDRNVLSTHHFEIQSSIHSIAEPHRRERVGVMKPDSSYPSVIMRFAIGVFSMRDGLQMTKGN